MKTFLISLFILICAFSLSTAQNSKVAPIKIAETLPEPPKAEPRKFTPPEMTVEERLKYYFLGREVKPAIIINNLDAGIYREKYREKIDLGGHKIVWISTPKGTKIKIDGDLISLENKKTLNIVDDDKPDDVDFANQWDQLKLFKFGERDLIGISMVNTPCTGTGCSVMMFLIYDLKTKTKTFFGTYRFLLDREFGLYDFGNDGSLEFLSSTYSGNSAEGDSQNLYESYTMSDDGVFRLQTDKNGKPYFMKRFYMETDTGYLEFEEKFESNWIEEIK